jgi:hypothetical protein
VFGTSTSLKQLGSIIDRLTYLGACDLFLEPSHISLKTAVGMVHPSVTGILLERQLECLSGSIWKEGIGQVVLTLLIHAKEAYSEDEMPVRRARILLQCMEFAYHMEPEDVVGLGCSQEMGGEVVRLLTRAVSSLSCAVSSHVNNGTSCRTSAETLLLHSSAHSTVLPHIFGSHCMPIVVWIRSKPH